MIRRTLVCAAAALLAACAGTGGIAPTHRPLPAADAADAADAPGWPDPAHGSAGAQWHDPTLDRLVAQALAGAPSLQAVQLRAQQAGRQLAAAQAARAPQVGLQAELSDQRFSRNGLVPPPLGGTTAWNNTVQLNGSWELDLFGRQRAAIDAALGSQRAAAADAQAAGVLLAANVASTYVNLARALEMRRLAESALAERGQVLAIVQQRVRSGLDSQVDLRQAEGAVAQTRLDVAAADETIARTRHALAELCGQRPDAFATLAPLLAPLALQPLPAGLPLNLLGRRADVVAERWRVEAALRDVDVARTQFYPNLNIVAFLGLQSIGLDTLLEAGSRTYGIGPALSLPVFEGGRLRANLGAKADAADIAVENYNATLLRALRETADEVASLRALETQAQEQAAALAAAESAFALSTQRYQAGLGNFLVVLTAEGNVLAQRRAAADLKARHLLAEVALARALGGGVHAEGPPTRIATQTP